MREYVLHILIIKFFFIYEIGLTLMFLQYTLEIQEFVYAAYIIKFTPFPYGKKLDDENVQNVFSHLCLTVRASIRYRYCLG